MGIKFIDMKEKPKEQLLKEFIDYHFDLETLFQVGFLKPEMKGNYNAIAKRICKFFGFKTVFEYKAKTIRAHLTYVDSDNPLEYSRPIHVNEKGELKHEPFVTEFKSWIEE